MANTSSRTLRLLSLLQTHRRWAAELEVLDPPEFVAYVREWGERFVRAASPGPASC
ncbi:hypothetical protein [Microbispora bryophytorum]|uniref:hypothetical protein n=1 Tax=Microbispora bryophytorum TaxID=1460882 RepID=UPI0033E2A136